jgi:hypothetical protein
MRSINATDQSDETNQRDRPIGCVARLIIFSCEKPTKKLILGFTSIENHSWSITTVRKGRNLDLIPGVILKIVPRVARSLVANSHNSDVVTGSPDSTQCHSLECNVITTWIVIPKRVW